MTLDPRALARLGATLPGLSLLASLACLAPGCGPPAFPPSAEHALLGQPVPEIHHRQTVDGRSLEVASGPILVKFFAEYCAPCKVTLPAAERVHEEFPDVAFVGVDEDESRETGKDLARRYSLTFPVVQDVGNVLAGRFRVSAMPVTFVADGAGVIRWVGGPGQTEEELRQAVRAARAAPVPR